MPPLVARSPRTSIRRPLSEPMLIRSGPDWQVCYKARGTLDGRKIEAWVYGPESLFFCEVGQESEIANLPSPNKVPFFDDQFLHIIELVDRHGKREERLAGANNIVAANAAWAVILNHRGGIIQMREGSRILRRRVP